MDKSLSILIKPASGLCNMRCKYCFYHDLGLNDNHHFLGMMSVETLEQIVEKAFIFANNSITFAFQGGEPTLRGLEFFKTFVQLVEKYNVNNIQTKFAIQTNGLLIDEQWSEFLSSNSFLVGLSMDGTSNIHNMHRIDAKGEGTFKRVMNTAKILKENCVEFNILCVVTKVLSRHGDRVYRFFKERGFRHLQFIPVLDSIEEIPGQNPYSLSPKSYGRFLITVFNNWYLDIQKGEYISIRMFDNILNMIKGCLPESCDMRGICSRGTVFEADGSMYPCDFYVMDRWKLGEIRNNSFEEMLTSDRMNDFVMISRNTLNECIRCEYKSICRGGCQRHKEPINDNTSMKNYFCQSYQMFYEHSLEKFKYALNAFYRNSGHI